MKLCASTYSGQVGPGVRSWTVNLAGAWFIVIIRCDLTQECRLKYFIGTNITV